MVIAQQPAINNEYRRERGGVENDVQTGEQRHASDADDESKIKRGISQPPDRPGAHEDRRSHLLRFLHMDQSPMLSNECAVEFMRKLLDSTWTACSPASTCVNLVLAESSWCSLQSQDRRDGIHQPLRLLICCQNHLHQLEWLPFHYRSGLLRFVLTLSRSQTTKRPLPEIVPSGVEYS